MPELRAAVDTETGNTQNGELHRQYIALLAARVVTGRLVNGGHFTVRKGGSVEARRLMRVLVEPEADRVLWLHVRVLLVPDQDERRGGQSGRLSQHGLANCRQSYSFCRTHTGPYGMTGDEFRERQLADRRYRDLLISWFALGTCERQRGPDAVG